jgi:hypothetical protein
MLVSEEKTLSVLRLTPAKIVVVVGLCTSAATVEIPPLWWRRNLAPIMVLPVSTGLSILLLLSII